MSEARSSGGLGLQAKLLVVTLGLVVAAFAAVFWIATDTARSGLVALSRQNLSLSSQNLARALRATLEDTRADATTAARLDLAAEPIDSGDPKNFEWFADELIQSKTKYAALVVADAAGLIVATNTVGGDGQELAETPLDQTLDAPWHRAALAADAGAPTWIPPSRPEALASVLEEGEQVVGYSLPVFDILEDRVGTVSFFVSLRHLEELLAGYVSRTDERVDSLALILDGEGHVLVTPRVDGDRVDGDRVDGDRVDGDRVDGDRVDGDRVDGDRLHDTWNEEIVDDSGAAWRAASGQSYYVVGSPVDGAASDSGFRVAQLQHLESFEASVNTIGETLLWTFAIAVLLVVLALTFVAARFLGPIRRLTVAIGETKKASEFEKLPVETADEVGELTTTFNAIFETLQHYEKDLEQKVEVRTAELRQAKQEVSDILDNMAQAIFTIGPERKVNGEFSAYCKELFGDIPIAGEDALDVLKLSPEADSQAHGSMRFWLDTVIGGDELQWMLAGGGPFADLDYPREGDEEDRSLRLEYAPIWHGGSVSKVMVIARDVSDVVRLEAEVERRESENKENLERVAELAQLDPELFERFLREAGEILDRCRSALAKLEADLLDEDAIDELFRAMHTLKANARVFKMTSVQDVAHEAEDLFQEVRDGHRELTSEALDDLSSKLEEVRESLEQYDRLGRQVLLGQVGSDADAIARGTVTLRLMGDLAGELPDLLLRAEESGDATSLLAIADQAKDLAGRAAGLGMKHLTAHALGLVEAIDGRDDAMRLLRASEELASFVAAQEAFHGELIKMSDLAAFLDETDPMVAKLVEDLAATEAGGAEPDAVLVNAVLVNAVLVNAVLGAAHSLEAHARGFGARALQVVARTMEDGVAALRDAGGSIGPDERATAAGHAARLGALLGDARGLLEGAGAARGERRLGASMRIPAARIMEVRRRAKEMARTIERGENGEQVRLSYAALDLAVRELTVVPLTDLLERFRKMVLDLAIELGKPIDDLEVVGGDIRVDTKLHEKMRDVLSHALRNAVDHGVEPPGERPKSKPEKGHIGVHCRWQGDDLLVEVRDDGRGIDLGRVRAAAIERRLVTEDQAEDLADEALLDLLFSPGFTTKKAVSDISGRGVGLDVIRTTMRGLKGEATLASKRGQGTTLTLTIPADYYQEL